MARWSGAGTHMKVGAHAGAKRRQNFLVVPLHIFGSTSRPTISRFGERFRDGHYNLVSFFAILLLTVLPVPSHF